MVYCYAAVSSSRWLSMLGNYYPVLSKHYKLLCTETISTAYIHSPWTWLGGPTTTTAVSSASSSSQFMRSRLITQSINVNNCIRFSRCSGVESTLSRSVEEYRSWPRPRITRAHFSSSTICVKLSIDLYWWFYQDNTALDVYHLLTHNSVLALFEW